MASLMDSTISSASALEEDDDNNEDVREEVIDDERIQSEVKSLLPNVNVTVMTTRQFIGLVAETIGMDPQDLMGSKEAKKLIKSTVREILDAGDENDEEEDEEEDENEEDSDSDDDDGKSSKPTKKRGGGGGGFKAEVEISEALASFLGNETKRMPRTEITKGLWNYIKQHKLQNPQDKREILLDAKLQSVFGVNKFTMFAMAKFVSEHVYPFKKRDETTTDKKRKAAASPKKTAKKSKASASSGAGGRKPPKKQTHRPYRLSQAMIDVTGRDVLARPQITKELWNYVRQHNLQNPSDKRQILCDDKLKKIMGGNSKVTIFSMNKYIGDHLLEKLDTDQYVDYLSENRANTDEEDNNNNDDGDDDDDDDDDDE